MPSILLENVFIWIVGAVFFVVAGFAISRGTNQRSFLWGGATLGVIAAVLGGFLVFGVKTERKAIQATVHSLAVAVANNDVDGVLALVGKNAPKTQKQANVYLRLAKIEWTKVRDFKILEINYHMSPPRALVSFRGSVGGQALGMSEAPFTVVVNFSSVELRKDEDGVWRVTDRCEFDYPGYSTNGEF